jgi:hypothetical protein
MTTKMTNTRLRRWLKDLLLLDYYYARAKWGTGGTRFKGQLTILGDPVRLLKKLLKSKGNSKKTDRFYCERFVYDPRFRHFFTEDQQRIARQRMTGVQIPLY